MHVLNLASRSRCKSRRAAISPRTLVAFCVLSGAALLLVLLVRGLQAQQASSSSSSPSASGENAAPPGTGNAGASQTGIRVRVELVNVPVTVLNKRGLPVINLTENDFKVYEDGVRQTIKYFDRETHIPLHIGLILDTSNSARRQLSFQQEAASEFVFNMLQGRSSKNQIFLQTFDATSSIAQDFTNDPELLNDKIRKLKAGGGKAVYDAVYFACEKLLKAGDRENTRRVVVLISDGLDVQSQHTLEEAVAMAHRAETAIYTIGNAAYGFSNPGDKYLEEIAEGTGGAAYFPRRETPGTDLGTGYLSHGQIGDTSQNTGLGADTGTYSAQRLVQLADSLESIGRELNEQYTLGYTPTRGTLDGTYRTIKVEAHGRGLTLRWKPGYYATAEQ